MRDLDAHLQRINTYQRGVIRSFCSLGRRAVRRDPRRRSCSRGCRGWEGALGGERLHDGRRRSRKHAAVTGQIANRVESEKELAPLHFSQLKEALRGRGGAQE